MKKTKRLFRPAIISFGIASAVSGTYANAVSIGDTQFSLSGYVKFDALVSDYSEGAPPSGSLTRDFYIPSLTPVSGGDEGPQLDFHIRQSRLRLTSSTPTESGDKLNAVVEIDFLVTDGGNERISNSFTPRVRHAYIEYKNWLIGQQWSTFMDTSILPETLDFIGVTDGVVFARQPQIRYSSGNWQFALENPESTITPFGGGSRIVSDDNFLPDAVVTYTYKQDWGYIKAAGIARQLAFDNGAEVDDSETGFGINISSKILFSNGDDLRLSFVTGSGLGRYFALNIANGAALDANNNLDAIDSTGFTLAYRHKWTEVLRSTVTFSANSIDNDPVLTGTGVTESSYSSRVNLLYSPTKRLTVGAEYGFASRETEGDLEGDLNRLQFSARYNF